MNITFPNPGDEGQVHTPNPDGRYAVCFFWKHITEEAARKYATAAILGNCYSVAGVDRMLRTLAANPQIVELIVVGHNSKLAVLPARAVYDLWMYYAEEYDEEDGTGHPMKGHTQERTPAAINLPLAGEINEAELGAIVRNVTLRIADDVATGAWPFPRHHDEQYTPPVRLYPLPSPTQTVFPHGSPGQRIEERTVKQAHLSAVAAAMRFGYHHHTHHGPTRDLLNMVTVIRDPRASVLEARQGMGLVDVPGAPCPTWEQVEGYYKQVMGSPQMEADPALRGRYTYGHRARGAVETPLRLHLGERARDAAEELEELENDPDEERAVVSYAEGAAVAWGTANLLARGQHPDQVSWAYHQLSERPGYRGITISFWHPDIDNQPEEPGKKISRPCLTTLIMRVVGGALCFTAVFRSHDLLGAYGPNLLALAHWQATWAGWLEVPCGPLTCLSSSAHVYLNNAAAAAAIIEKHDSSQRTARLLLDQRSHWRVYHLDGKLTADAMDPATGAVMATFQANGPDVLRERCVRSGLIQSIGAAAWLGAEIRRVMDRE
jgi:hypothetical protein